jgi:N-acetylglucosamine-6-phosphate deacetylase
VRTVLTATRLYTPDHLVERPVVVIEDGMVADVFSLTHAGLPEGRHVELPESTLVPALFDVHIHGSGGHDVMEGTESALSHIGSFLARRGVGAYCATTVTAPLDSLLHSLSSIAKLIHTPLDGARPVGIHLEGPFLSPHKRGAHAESQLLTPSIALFDRMWDAAEGNIRIMTMAPELPNAEETIAHATQLGVRVSLGHSDANGDAARAGVMAGAVSATHTFNAMRRFDHRDPGLLGEVLDNDRLFAEIICDGLHVDPSVVRLFWKAKDGDRAILITDAMAGAGMPDGPYRLGEMEVRVKNGRCIIGEDTLAGSTLTLDRGLYNFMQFTGSGLDRALPLATRNPARMTGFESEIGAIAPGRSADIAVLSARNEVIGTILRGVPQLGPPGDGVYMNG